MPVKAPGVEPAVEYEPGPAWPQGAGEEGVSHGRAAYTMGENGNMDGSEGAGTAIDPRLLAL